MTQSHCYEKTRHDDEKRPSVGVHLAAQAAKPPHQTITKEHDPPPRRQAEQVVQQVCQPCTEPATRIRNPRHLGGMRPTGIRLTVTEQDQSHI